MKAAIRRIPILLNTTGEIIADKVDEEAGIPYSCPAHGDIVTITMMSVDQHKL
jgi:hypothetical protein